MSAETEAFTCSLCIQTRLFPRLIENVGLEPLCGFPKAVCSHYTTFSLSPQPATIRRFRFGKPVCCQLHHADIRLQSSYGVPVPAVPVPAAISMKFSIRACKACPPNGGTLMTGNDPVSSACGLMCFELHHISNRVGGNSTR